MRKLKRAKKGQLKELVRGSVEETLNELLEKEAESLTQAARYERSEARQGYRSGHYDRNLTTTSGDVKLHVPRLKGVSFETAIIERYCRRESSVEEALIEMYLAGVSVRRVEDITEALWGSKVSPATISELNKKAYVHIEDWRNRPLQGGHYPYVYVDGIYLRRNWGGEYGVPQHPQKSSSESAYFPEHFPSSVFVPACFTFRLLLRRASSSCTRSNIARSMITG